MSRTIVTVPNPIVVEAKDPACEICQHEWFAPHLHPDGTGRCISMDTHTIYVQAMFDGIITCTCINGQHHNGSRPNCWHSNAFENLLALANEAARAAKPQSQRTAQLRLEDLF